MTLTDREERFAAEFVANGGRGKDAALAAGFPPTSAKQRASEMRRRPAVADRIAELGRAKAAELDISHSWLVEQALWYHEAAKRGDAPFNAGVKGLDLACRMLGAFQPTRHQVEERRIVVTMHLGGEET
jgi:hypothetical protein